MALETASAARVEEKRSLIAQDELRLKRALQVRERERDRERGERETSGYEPFALHAPIHWAIWGARCRWGDLAEVWSTRFV